MSVAEHDHETGLARDEDAQHDRALFLKRRRSRSIAIALALAGLVILFYVVTLVKLGPEVLNRPM